MIAGGTGVNPMPSRSSFVEPGDCAEVGDDVVFHGEYGNLVRGIVADRGVSPLSNITGFRLQWSKKNDDRAGRPFWRTIVEANQGSL